MAYTAKTDWKSNDIVKETDFNRIEQGISDLYDGKNIEDISEITELKDTDMFSIVRTVNNAIVQYKSKLSTLVSMLNKIFAKTETYTTTVQSSSWNGSSSPYTADISLSGIKSTDNPMIDLVVSETLATATNEVENWSYVYKIITNNDGIKLYATEKPAVALSLQLKVVR